MWEQRPAHNPQKTWLLTAVSLKAERPARITGGRDGYSCIRENSLSVILLPYTIHDKYLKGYYTLISEDLGDRYTIS